MSSVFRAEILDALALRVNFFTVDQVARTWFTDHARPKDSARRALTQLIHDGLIAPKRLLNAFPEQPIEEPLFVWEVGDPAPGYNQLSAELRSRWHGLAWTETQAFSITAEGAEQIPGGSTPTLKPEDENHDLHMSAVFLVIKQRYPDWIPHWIADRDYDTKVRGRRYEDREKTPDAFLRIDGEPRVIDFGGAYHPKKVGSIHRYWSALDIPYELW
jgi:hypothetical protein